MALCRYHKVVLTFASNDTYRAVVIMMEKKVKRPTFNRQNNDYLVCHCRRTSCYSRKYRHLPLLSRGFISTPNTVQPASSINSFTTDECNYVAASNKIQQSLTNLLVYISKSNSSYLLIDLAFVINVTENSSCFLNLARTPDPQPCFCFLYL